MVVLGGGAVSDVRGTLVESAPLVVPSAPAPRGWAAAERMWHTEDSQQRRGHRDAGRGGH